MLNQAYRFLGTRAATKVRTTHSVAKRPLLRSTTLNHLIERPKQLFNVHETYLPRSGLRWQSRGTILRVRSVCTKVEPEEEAPTQDTIYLRAYNEYCEGNTSEALNLLDTVEESDPHYSLAVALQGRIATMKGEYDKALALFEKSLQVNDANSLTWYYKAGVHEILKDREEAIRCLSDSLDVDPEFHLARTELAGHLIQKGDYKAGLDHCNYCLSVVPEMEQAKYWKAKALFHLKRYSEARMALDKWDDWADTFSIKLGALAGEIELALNDVAKAKALFVKAYKENKKGFPDEALCKLATILMEQGRAAEASKLLRTRLLEEEDFQHDSDLVFDLQRVYGHALLQCGDMANALGSFKFSLKLNPKQLDVHMEVIRLLQGEEALEATDFALTHFPSSADLKLQRLGILAELKQFDEALQILEELQDEQKDQTWLGPYRCLVLISADRLAEAEALYHQVKGVLSVDPMGIIHLAKAAFGLGKGEDAKAFIQTLINLKELPEDMIAIALPFVLNELNDDQVTNRMLIRIVKLHPNQVHYLSLLARHRMKMGDLQFALTVWTHIAKLVPDDATTWNSIGDIYTIQQKHFQAITQFKRAQECEGPDAALHEAATKEGMALLLLQRWDQAIDKLETTCQGHQHSDMALKVLGSLLAGEMGPFFGIEVPSHYHDQEQAVNVLKAALNPNIEIRREPEQTHLLLARTLLRLDRKPEALEQIEMARALVPNSPDLEETVLLAQQH